jgi:hypothetical protein
MPAGRKCKGRRDDIICGSSLFSVEYRLVQFAGWSRPNPKETAEIQLKRGDSARFHPSQPGCF